MKRTGKNLLKSMLAFVTTIALVLGALPIDGLVPVAQAAGAGGRPDADGRQLSG